MYIRLWSQDHINPVYTSAFSSVTYIMSYIKNSLLFCKSLFQRSKAEKDHSSSRINAKSTLKIVVHIDSALGSCKCTWLVGGQFGQGSRIPQFLSHCTSAFQSSKSTPKIQVHFYAHALRTRITQVHPQDP